MKRKLITPEYPVIGEVGVEQSVTIKLWQRCLGDGYYKTHHMTPDEADKLASELRAKAALVRAGWSPD